MTSPQVTTASFTAFHGHSILQAGPVEPVVRAVKTHFDQGNQGKQDERNGPPVLVFEDATGKQVDFDLEGTPEQVVERLAWHPLFRNPDDLLPKAKHPGPGRPRLGVVSREISLFPRHWEWLERQPQGASAAIRRLIEAAREYARLHEPEKERALRAREAAGSFMWSMAGNLPNFEEASRALYSKDAGHAERLNTQIADWPRDVREYVLRLLEGSPPARPASFA